MVNKCSIRINNIRFISICLVGVSILILLINIHTSQAAVSLIYFNAILVDGNRVQFKWETGTEINNSGFSIEKMKEGENTYKKIILNIQNAEICTEIGEATPSCENDFIVAMGNISGYTYQNIFDTNLDPGAGYQYRLVAEDSNGSEERSDPINPWATLTPTKTNTPITTSTTTSYLSTKTNTTTPNSTPKKTKTPVNNSSPTPLPPSATHRIILPSNPPRPSNQTASPIFQENTPTSSEAALALPTLGLPSVTMIFPGTAIPNLAGSITPAVGTIPNNAGWFTPQRMTVLGLIVSIWVILGGGFFFVLKKIE